MALREKTKRRATWVVAGVVVMAALGTGGYFARKQQLRSRAESRYTEGLELLKNGSYFDALHAIGPYVQWHPKDPDALYAYARARLQVEMPEGKHIVETLSLLRQTVDLDPNNLDAHRDLIKLYSVLRFDTEALLAAEDMLRKQPKDPVALSAQVDAYGRAKKFDDALRAAELWVTAYPDDVEARLSRIGALSKAKGNEAAVAVAEQNVTANPQSPVALLERTEAYLVGGNESEAGKSLVAVIKLVEEDPKPPEAKVIWAITSYCDRTKQYAAHAAATRLIVRGADAGLLGFETEALRRLFYAGKVQEAADRAAKTASDKVVPPGTDIGAQAAARELPAVQAFVLMQAGRTDEAKAIVARIAEGQKDWAAILTELMAPTIDDQKLIQKLEEVTNRSRQAPIFLSLLADAYERVGEREAALRNWELAAKFAPSWGHPLAQNARTSLMMGRLQPAIENSRAAVERAPENIEARRIWTQVWVESIRAGATVDLKTLQAEFDKTESAFPGDPMLLALRARLQSHLKDVDGVRQRAQQVLAAGENAPLDAMIIAAEACRESKLTDMVEPLLVAAEKKSGPIPETVVFRARNLAASGDVAGGLKLITDGRAASAGKNDRDWAIAEAAYLERSNDPRAKENWIALANAHPKDARVQWLVVGAASVHSDRAAVSQALDRLKGLTGQFGLTYRMTRAGFLLESAAKNSSEAAEAAVLLGDVVRAAPELVNAHVLLAAALERMGNIPGALEQYGTLDPTKMSADMHLQYARLLQMNGDTEKSRNALKLAMAAGNLTPAQSQLAASLAAKQGDAEAAIKLLGNDEAGAGELMVAALHRQRSEYDKVDAMLPKLLRKDDVASLSFVADYQASRGRMAEANQILERLKTRTGDEAIAAGLARGDWFSRYGQPASAIEAYEAVVHAKPTDGTAWRRLLAMYCRQNELDKAADAARRAADALPNDEALKEFAAQAPALQDRIKDSIYAGLLFGLLQSAPEQIEPLRDGIRILTQKEITVQRVQTGLRNLADRHTRNLPLQMAAARVMYLGGRYDDAATIATRAMEAFPTDATSAQLAASALSSAGRNEEARSAGEKWRQRSSGDTMPPDLLVSALDLKLGKRKEALSRLEPYMAKVLENPDSNPALLLQFGRTMVASNQADNFMTQVRPLLPKFATARQVIMRLAAEENIGNRSLIWLREVQPNLNQKSMAEHIIYAEALARLNARAPQPAIRSELDATIAKLADEASAWDDLSLGGLLSTATIQETYGNNAGAEKTYRRILKSYPDTAIALNNLAYLLVRTGGSLTDALSLADQAVAVATTRADEDLRRGDYLDTRSRIQEAMKRYDDAIASIEEALRQQPQNPEWLLQLGKLQLDAGQKDKAKETMRSIRDINPREEALSSEGRTALQRLRAEIQ